MEENLFEQRTDLGDLQESVGQLKAEISKVIVGQENMIELLLAGILYVAGVFFVERFQLGATALVIILGAAVLFRVELLPARTTPSDDVYRYQWDGRAQRAGLNPYVVFPDSPELDWLQNPEHPDPPGPEIPTIYPPLAELVYRRIETIPGYKRVSTVLDLASVAILLPLLAAMKQPLHRVLAYAWNPAILISFAMSGHFDSLAIVTLLAAILFLVKNRPALSMVALALSPGEVLSGAAARNFLEARPTRAPGRLRIFGGRTLCSVPRRRLAFIRWCAELCTNLDEQRELLPPPALSHEIEGQCGGVGRLDPVRGHSLPDQEARLAAVVDSNSHRRSAAGVPDCLSVVLHLVDPVSLFLSERGMAAHERYLCPGLQPCHRLRSGGAAHEVSSDAVARIRSRLPLAGLLLLGGGKERVIPCFAGRGRAC